MITIIIATHNRKEKLKRLLNSLNSQTFKEFMVLIVNDYPKQLLLNQYDFAIKIIENGNADLWWAESVNVGLKNILKSKSNYILILNDDVIIENNYLFEAVNFQKLNPDVIQGPIIFDLVDNKKLWAVGGLVSWPFKGPYHNLTYDNNTNFTEVQWLPGMGTFFHKKILSQTGLMKSKLHPQYLSDTDYTLTAKSLGFPVLVNHKLRLFNETSSTGGISENKIHLADLKNIFFHKSSPEYFNSRITFIKNHTKNKIEFILSVLFHYLKLSLFISKKLFF